jgi:hypothetical protein
VLLICGSLNQTSMMHAIGKHLCSRFDCFFTPYYTDGPLRHLKPLGLLDMTIMGGPMRARTDRYLAENRLPLDLEGRMGPYDLVLTCSDLIVQKNIRESAIVLVQEGMTDPEDFSYHLVRKLNLPRWLASTSTTGLSLAYEKFCVASEGYRQFFARKGIPLSRMEVTGIPNYDNCASLLQNDFPHRGYVLACTSDTRETFKRDDRKKFIDQCLTIAAGRQLIFKLHPNENYLRSRAEIQRWAPLALVFHDANTDHMIANCDVLVTQFSTVVYTGLALGKECHSYFDLEHLKRLVPLQNGGTSAGNIARICEGILDADLERRTA